MGFWEWHKKMWNSKEPVIKFQVQGIGDEIIDFKLDFFGSQFFYTKEQVKKLEDKSGNLH